MARQLVLDSQEWIEIINKNKEVVGGFYWNPSDLDIVKRAKKVIDYFNNVGVDDNTDIFVLSEEVKKQFNYLLQNDNAADELFKYSNPFTPLPNGTFFAEYVLDTVVSFIETEMGTRMKKSAARIKRYTEKYGR